MCVIILFLRVNFKWSILPFSNGYIVHVDAVYRSLSLSRVNPVMMFH